METQSYLLNKVKDLELAMQKHNQKQKAENSRFTAQINQIKEIKIDLDGKVECLKDQMDILESHI